MTASRGGADRPRAGRSRFTLRRARADRASRATRWPRRCWPTASGWSARSFKYHRPRGVMTAGSEEPNALVTVGQRRARRSPTPRATMLELYEGLAARSQNRLAVARPVTCWRSTTWPRRSSARGSTTRPSCGRAASGNGSTSR
ncbi:MAG: 2Fe-2S iron-sulfur cluster-binding protein [Roseovarius sp.]|nr:2Fe-2S iron-sulfur cluster-binding protein [Roseovarius sp.]